MLREKQDTNGKPVEGERGFMNPGKKSKNGSFREKKIKTHPLWTRDFLGKANAPYFALILWLLSIDHLLKRPFPEGCPWDPEKRQAPAAEIHMRTLAFQRLPRRHQTFQEKRHSLWKLKRTLVLPPWEEIKNSTAFLTSSSINLFHLKSRCPGSGKEKDTLYPEGHSLLKREMLPDIEKEGKRKRRPAKSGKSLINWRRKEKEKGGNSRSLWVGLHRHLTGKNFWKNPFLSTWIPSSRKKANQNSTISSK